MTTKAAGPVPITGTGQVGAAGPGRLMGYSIRDTSGATNTVKLFDGTSAAGTILGAFQLAANADRSISIPAGLFFRLGVFASTTGAVEGSVWV
jgi:hypothetical protein